ncbi:MAG: LemA family protein [Bacteroidota bacterium]|jgi:LemA protein
MNSKQIRWAIIAGVIIILLLWVRSNYNGLVDADINVEKQWGTVTTRYQERADKIGQLVDVVKGSANFEKSTLTEITEARASVGKMELKADEITPENLEKFEAAQSKLKGTFDRLMVVVEKYPDLKSTQNFSALQFEVAGMENRIATARTDYNASVADFNSRVRRFPSNIFAGMFGFEKKEMFKNQAGTENRPTIDFSDKPATDAK